MMNNFQDLNRNETALGYTSQELVEKFDSYLESQNKSDEQTQITMPTATLTQTPLFDEVPDPDEDPLLKKAIEIIRKEERASISMLQRKLGVGYTRAARMVDRLEELEIIGKPDSGSGVRLVLDFGDEEE